MDAFNDLNAQIAQFPEWLQWWLRWMQMVLIVLPFFFIKRIEAQILLIAQVLNFAVGGLVLYFSDNMVTKLFGLGHVFWAVVFGYWLLWLWRGQIDFNGRPWFRAWFFTALATLAISLPFDAYDLLIYAIGYREPVIAYYAAG